AATTRSGPEFGANSTATSAAQATIGTTRVQCAVSALAFDITRSPSGDRTPNVAGRAPLPHHLAARGLSRERPLRALEALHEEVGEGADLGREVPPGRIDDVDPGRRGREREKEGHEAARLHVGPDDEVGLVSDADACDR